MDRTRCLEVVAGASGRMAETARESPGGSIPRYSGRDVESLIRHVITIHEWVTAIVADLPERPPTQAPPSDDLAGDDLLNRFDRSWRGLVSALDAADPDAEVWTFGVDKTVAFWLRRMAHETSMHAWDAESAVRADPPPIPHDVAISGLEEGLHVHCHRPLRKTEVGGSGEGIVVDPIDAPETWTVILDPVGVTVESGAASSSVARLAGTASDLWLALGCRIPLERLDTEGDVEAIARFERAIRSIPAAL